MPKIINKILLIILIILLALLAYKVTRPINTTTASISTSTVNTYNEEIDLKSKIENTVKEYILNNPEIIIESIERLQKRKMQEVETKVKGYIEEKKSEIENSTDSPFIGNENGDVVIVSFYDYNCSYCKKGDNYINQLLNIDKNIKVILKPFPILGEASVYAAKIALAVYKIDPSKFQPFHESLIQMSPITQEAIKSLLNANNIDVNLIQETIEKNEIKEIINKNFELAGNLRIQGAPAYIINQKLISGLINLEELQHIISEIRKNAKTNS